MMGFLSNLVDGFKVKNNDADDEYFLDDDYYDAEEGEDDYYEEEEPKTNSFFSRRNNSSRNDEQSKSSGLFNRGKVVPIQQNPNLEVTMKRPRSLDDSRDICDDLLMGKAVVLNLEGIDGSTAQRIIDFTLGSIYSIEGDLRQISKFIFIASPHNVELSGEFGGEVSRAYTRPQSRQSDMPRAAAGFGYNG